MVRKRGEHGVLILTAAFFISFTFIALNYYRIAVEQKDVPAAQLESTLTIEAGRCQGTIYDRNMRPLINAAKKRIAAAVPSALDREQTAEYAIDKDSFYEQFDKGQPFVFDCSDNALESDGLTIFEVPIRYSEHQTAQHIIGYLSDDKGADGIEYAYDDILRNNFPSNSVSYKKGRHGTHTDR